MDKKSNASKLCASNIIQSLQDHKENFFQQNISSLDTTGKYLNVGYILFLYIFRLSIN